jgi:hypothetical protein
MVDLKSENRDDDDAGLFLHVPTGRFRRLRLPVLRGHIVLGASDGLIVLGDRERLFVPRLLNPLTGDMLHFATLLQEHFGDGYEMYTALYLKKNEMYTAVSGGSHPTLVLWREWEWKWFTVVHADPTCAKFTEEDIGTYLMTMVTFQGNIYYAGMDGQVFKFVAPAEPCDHELEQCNHELVDVAQMAPDMDVEGRRMKGNSAASYLQEYTLGGVLGFIEERLR